MFELLVLVLFCWIFFGSIRLMFKVAWGLAKILAVILFIMALPSLIGCLFSDLLRKSCVLRGVFC